MRLNIEYDSDPVYGSEWFAYDYDNYDADCDQDGFFSVCPMGHGKTKFEAIRDLIDQLEEADGSG
jgi:hypothetical protein